MRAEVIEGLKEHGIVGDRKVVLVDNQVIDGWQFLGACVELDMKPTFAPMPKGIEPEAYISITNLRRHETEDDVVARVKERRERVAAARANGKTLREIAEDEGVSKDAVARDLKEVAETTEKPMAVVSRETTATEEPDEDAPKVGGNTGKVMGRDGKIYPATKPKPPLFCDRCQRLFLGGGGIKNCKACEEIRGGRKVPAPPDDPKPQARSKSGQPAFDEKKLNDTFGEATRAIDKLKNALASRSGPMGAGQLPKGGRPQQVDDERLRAALSKVAQGKTRHDRCQELMSVLLEELKMWKA